jgi:PAS domain S-box-containing protein
MSNLELERSARILVIDDNRAIHDDFRKILGAKPETLRQLEESESALFGEEGCGNRPEAAQFQIDSAYQGEEGLALVERARMEGRPYSLAFVEARIPPGWDGIETTARLWEVDPDLQIVICTSYSDYSWDEMYRRLGQSDRLVILKKPFEEVEAVQLARSLSRKFQLLRDSKEYLTNLERTVAGLTAQLVEERTKFKSIFENLPAGLYQTTPDGRYLSANPALAAIYGYGSPEELMADVPDVEAKLYVVPGRHAELQRLLEQEGQVEGFESEVQCRDGSKKWISETARRITDPDGRLLGYLGCVVEIRRS